MNDELIEHIAEEHSRQIAQISERLDKLEQEEMQGQVRIDNLCEKLASLTKSLHWLIGFLATSCVGLISYGLEKLLF